MSWQIDGYHELRELGRGAAGRVVLATHDRTGTPVAIKYLDPDADFLVGFRAEARMLSTLDSPDIVRLYEYVEEPAGAAIVMELVNGATLRAILREGPLPAEAALLVLRGALSGLAVAHRAGVVHRDFKPDNVMVDDTGASKLTDFGIAARAGQQVDVAGTPSYLAPELWAGTVANEAGDIYAATATFVECLTGRPPYPGPELTVLRRQHENAPIPLDGLPAAVHDIVRRGLAKRPDQRPADSQRFLRDLEEAARAGYGEDWAERGRRQLAERAALLALLFPLGGGMLSGSAVATTALGRLAVPALAVLLVLGLAGGAAATLTGGQHDNPAAEGRTTVSAGPDPSGPAILRSGPPPSAGAPSSVGPSADAPISPAPHRSGNPPSGPRPSTAAPPVPPPPPPPPAMVVKFGITAFAYTNGGVGPSAQVTLYVLTDSTGPVQLTITYTHDKTSDKAITHTFTLQGNTTYTPTDTQDMSLWCGWTITATATAKAGNTAGPDSRSLTGVPC